MRGSSIDLDPALVELAQQRVVLERRELVALDDLGELAQLDRPGELARLEQRLQLVLREQGFDVDGRHGRSRDPKHQLSHLRPLFVQPRSRRTGPAVGP